MGTLDDLIATDKISGSGDRRQIRVVNVGVQGRWLRLVVKIGG